MERTITYRVTALMVLLVAGIVFGAIVMHVEFPQQTTFWFTELGVGSLLCGLSVVYFFEVTFGPSNITVRRTVKVIMRVVPHNEQRYNTVGDWYFNWLGDLVVTVSHFNDPRVILAIQTHEYVETFLCVRDGVTQEMVDKFDLAWAAARAPGDTSEPGDDPNAPYHTQHQVADRIERDLCAETGLLWDEHVAAQAALMRSYNPGPWRRFKSWLGERLG